MAFQVSPGVLVQEKDLTRIIPAVSTSIGAIAGTFTKGPMDEVVSISSEQELVSTFGKPNNSNFEDFFSASNFLQYSNALRVVRVQNSSVSNATESGSAFVIKNTIDYTNNYAAGQASVGLWAARTAGAHGNSLQISTCPSATAYEEVNKTTVADAAMAVGDTVVTVSSATGISAGDIVNFGDQYEYRVISVSTNDLNIVRKEEPAYFGTSESSGLHQAPTNGAQVRRRWKYYDLFNKAPGTSPAVSAKGGSGDELHIVVIDEDGEITGTKGDVLDLQNPSNMPDPSQIERIEEPWIKSTIITPDEYLGSIIKICQDKRGVQTNLSYSGKRAVLSYDLPLNEVVFDFNDKLKSISSGYASFDYEISGYREGDLVKLGILVNSEPVDALAMIIHKDFAQTTGRQVCEKLKDLIPRHNFMIPVQAAIGGKIVARESIKGFKKDVLTKIHGGGATDRKRKLLEKQKRGKARSKQFGKVEIPQEAFIGVLKINKDA